MADEEKLLIRQEEKKKLEIEGEEQLISLKNKERSSSLKIETEVPGITLSRTRSLDFDSSPSARSPATCVDHDMLFVPQVKRSHRESVQFSINSSNSAGRSENSSTVGNVVSSLIGSVRRLKKSIGCCKGVLQKGYKEFHLNLQFSMFK